MANRIQQDYERHMQENSPDMEKLWARIEQRIDENGTAAEDVQVEKPKITVKRGGFIKYAAAAACLIAVVAGTVIFMNSKDTKVKTAESETNKAAYSAKQKSDADSTLSNDGIDDAIDAKSDDTANKRAKSDNDENYKSAQNLTAADASAVNEEESLTPRNRMKNLMVSEQYTSASKEQKVKMVEELAQKMKESGDITDYTMKIKEVNSRIEMTLPDGTIQGMML